MKKWMISLMLIALVLSGCVSQAADTRTVFDAKVGILLSDTGLGDGSFNDAAFSGLERARNELNILFDYREAPEGNYEEKLLELVEGDYDLIVGLGFSVQEALEKTAEAYPDQQFLLIDGTSEIDNVISMTFKDHEGSFLVGVVAAMATKTNTLGFIGGVDAPVIHRFEAGFTAGAKYVNPDITIITEYAGDFGDADLGRSIAAKQIEAGADFIYPAAGYTGTGAILEAQDRGIFSAGVDTDQFYTAEKSVVTSMMKNVDIAVYELVNDLISGELPEESYELGLKEDGVGLAEIRLFEADTNGKAMLIDVRKKIISGDIEVPETVK
ncbi:BMP family protein [Jeotgalibacillus sp. R-1-5s-1]|uniref:BMP family lipoprotein n=1 Tax=Jeotgalibacillus sp. R-1-5s-1 TaxID=2555897 RepID=UPI00106D81B4|nr:BMP family ABC transporter substrate-binding protein [Jeotgalibacillus sp. R-1-5s-1]TFE01214.1 BMP family ABC transporter substrate-binding protein [Jeotgalibacillus sp. R-1-5s-1]